MIKQQIGARILAAYAQPILLAKEGKAGPQLDQKPPDISDESAFHDVLRRVVRDRQKLETIRVFQLLFRQVGLKSRERFLKVSLGLALTAEEIAFDSVDHHQATSASFNGGTSVPQALNWALDLVQQVGVMSLDELSAFVRKADQALMASVHLLIVDLFAPGPRAPSGIHRAIWGEGREGDFALPDDKPLTC
jgi:hypothetical protein